jgi:methylenetetrahydrofolate dehydrogenase (NADP+)/methenyltetrahydrofolate cyclohydrolase
MRPILNKQAVVVDGLKIAKRVLEQAGKRIDDVREKFDLSHEPRLSIIYAENQPDIESFLRQKKKSWEISGSKSSMAIDTIDLSQIKIDRKHDIENLIKGMNSDARTTAVQLYLPLKTISSYDEIADILHSISPLKDVEGARPSKYLEILREPLENTDNLVLPSIYLAVYEVLKEYGVSTKGKRGLLIGQQFSSIYSLSGLFGKLGMIHSLWGMPFEDDFQAKHPHKYEELKHLLSESDVIISGFGRSGFIPEDCVKKGSTIIDLAINFDPKTGKIGGDFVSQNLLEKVNLITPVPKGIGPITTAMVFRNLALLYENQANLKFANRNKVFI